jgi:mannose-6-phosphate isomerase
VDTYSSLSTRPILLQSNRVWRTYSGGKSIENWQGKSNAADSDFPEEWVASTVIAKNVGREHIVEGPSKLIFQGKEVQLRDVIESDPVAFLGQQHVDVFDSNPGILVKVLDAAERLTIQVHPDVDFAQRMFSSRFGKTESWYVLGGRSIDGEEPILLFGFKPGITRESWKEMFEAQQIPEMINALHRVPLKQGDVYLVEGGIPHAIGKGCFLIEVQEPTDLTLRTERTTPRGHSVPDLACHQGIGFDQMLDCFHYDGLTYEETMKRWKKEPRLLQQQSGGSETVLIDKEDTDRFNVHVLEVQQSYSCSLPTGFCIAIIISGTGSLVWDNETLPLNASDQLFLPAGLKDVTWINQSATGEAMHIVMCYPPSA